MKRSSLASLDVLLPNWMRAPILPFDVAKEIRALLPLWLGTVGMVLMCLVITGPAQFLSVWAYAFGSVSLGAWSIGHEHTNRTLGLLLSHPTTRARVLGTKLRVLAAMLLILGAVGAIVFESVSAYAHAGFDRQHAYSLALLAMPLVCGLFIAPFWTIVCRGPLPGLVFTVATPAALYFVGWLTGAAQSGTSASVLPAIQASALSWTWIGMLCLSPIAMFVTWRMFARLEAFEGRGREIRLATWFERTAPSSADMPSFSSRQPVWLLIRKELRLQQAAFALSGIYLVMLSALAWLDAISRSGPPAFGIAALFGTAICVLIGSTPSAEERHFGTLQWQILLPMASWKQWMVKVGTAWGLALVFAIGPPAVVALFHPMDEMRFRTFALPEISLIVVLLTTASLYASSLSVSGIRAVLTSAILLPGLGLIWWTVAGRVVDLARQWAFELRFGSTKGWTAIEIVRRGYSQGFLGARVELLREILLLALLAGLVALMLRFALINHRSAERQMAVPAKQVVWMTAYVAIAAAAFGTALGLGGSFF